ncbi:transforming growth factor beta regulator 1 [Anopheles aquasalis]|uniref:transforming growth factor beta regulator 1 n=1 Tax=Anopheles aquasalis TaxID=42839 RepID=UPI00215B42C7|nr:transforming growth factor beta regulator 1 [Anopheles aquasalis]
MPVGMERATASSSNPSSGRGEEEIQAKYRRKYRRLQRIMKDLVFENAALCDHITQVQEKIGQRTEERRYLLKKLLDHENEMETQLGRPCSKLNELIANSLPPKRQYKKREKNPPPNGASGSAADGSTKEGTGKTPMENGVSSEQKGKEGGVDGEQPKGETGVNRQQQSAGRGRGGGKGGKRGRPAGQPNKKKRAEANLKDLNRTTKGGGHPSYPIVVGDFTIHNLGEIVPDRVAYSSEHTIYPIGYCATRPYGHYEHPEKRCLYTCRILDGGAAPRFEITPEGGSASDVFLASSTDACHALLLQRINASLNMRRTIDSRPAGDWFFGLRHPTISSLIQSFPSSRQCANYRAIKRESFAGIDKDNDPTLNYEALLRHITLSSYHTVPEIKEEPPDELFDLPEGNSSSSSNVNLARV